MPIKIPTDLPAVEVLNSENIFVMTEQRAATQEIRPLKILLLNLMPKKIETETQLCRLLGNTPLQVELELIMTKSHSSKNTSEEHMLAFYKTFAVWTFRSWPLTPTAWTCMTRALPKPMKNWSGPSVRNST